MDYSGKRQGGSFKNALKLFATYITIPVASSEPSAPCFFCIFERCLQRFIIAPHPKVLVKSSKFAIDFQIINFTRIEGGRRISYTSTTDNAVKLFIWKSIHNISCCSSMGSCRFFLHQFHNIRRKRFSRFRAVCFFITKYPLRVFPQ